MMHRLGVRNSLAVVVVIPALALAVASVAAATTVTPQSDLFRMVVRTGIPAQFSFPVIPVAVTCNAGQSSGRVPDVNMVANDSIVMTFNRVVFEGCASATMGWTLTSISTSVTGKWALVGDNTVRRMGAIVIPELSFRIVLSKNGTGLTCTIQLPLNAAAAVGGAWTNAGVEGNVSILRTHGDVEYVATPSANGGCNAAALPTQGIGGLDASWEISDTSQPTRSIRVA
jgi:hypothetical protein